MNAEALHFSLVRYQPDMQRQEVVNVGVVIFGEDGPQVSMASNLGKLLALDPNFRIAQVYDQGRKLQEALTALHRQGFQTEQAVEMFGVGGSISLSPTGMLARAGRDLEAILSEIHRDLVSAPVQRRSYQPRASRLHTELRRVFQQAKILGSRPDDIRKHLVVPNFPIDPDVGLFAEFAIRNGQLHVTETVDFRTSTPAAKRQEAQAKTLLLLQARDRIGSTDLKRYVVVTGVSSQVQSSLTLLGRYTEDLIVRESAQDWNRYVDAMHRASKPDPQQIQ